MKRIFLLAGVLGTALSSCLNNDDEAIQEEQMRYEENIQEIQQYMIANGLSMEEVVDPQTQRIAYYYQILSPGHPDTVISQDSARITVGYQGWLLNDDAIADVDSMEIDLVRQQVLDAPDDVLDLPPGGLFNVIQEVGQGGSIRMLFPAAYAYGSGTGEIQEDMATIPSYAPVGFEMDLLEVNATTQ